MTVLKRTQYSCLVVSIAVMVTSLGRTGNAEPMLPHEMPSDAFYKTITALAQQGHVAFVAEGVPLRPRLLQSVTRLTKPASLDDEVKVVADAYDYSAQRKGNVYILKKRYSNLDDLPALTPIECENALLLLQKVAEPFNPHALSHRIQFFAPPGSNLRPDQVRILHPLVDTFASSLSPDQLAAMHKSDLKISSLSQDQQKLAKQLRLSLYLQYPMDRMSLVRTQLERTEQSAIFTQKNTSSLPHAFGYLLPREKGNHAPLSFHPLPASGGLDNIGVRVASNQKTDSPDSVELAQMTVGDSANAAQTLAAVVTSLNGQSSAGAFHVDVDAAVTAKPVIVAGMGNAPAQQVLNALADVYGLRLANSLPVHPGSLTLTLPDVSPPSELAVLPSSLRQALPEPFRRAAHLDEIVTEQQQFYDFWQIPRFPKHLVQASLLPEVEETAVELEQAMRERKRANSGSTEFRGGLERIQQAQAALSTLRLTAIRGLRTSIEPELRTKPNGVAIAELSEPQHEALATLFLAEAIQYLGDLLTQAVPDTVLHFDQAVLGGGVQEKSEPPSFSVLFQMPLGGVQINGGGINVPYNKADSKIRDIGINEPLK